MTVDLAGYLVNAGLTGFILLKLWAMDKKLTRLEALFDERTGRRKSAGGVLCVE
jgi:hypothetical protein